LFLFSIGNQFSKLLNCSRIMQSV